MKAIVCESYGGVDVLKLKEVTKPLIQPNEILIKIKAAAVNSADIRLRKADPWAVRLFFGLTKPKYSILGGVFAGEIVSVGSNVRKFKVGDRVVASSALQYGFGAYAEYKSLPENGIIQQIPKNLTEKEAAALPFGGITANYFIEKASLKAGQRILINGVSGSVGIMLLQLAKQKGVHVTGICSAKNHSLIKSLGADSVLDYTLNPISEIQAKYDVVFNTIDKQAVKTLSNLLKPTGTLVLVAANFREMLKASLYSIFSKQKLIAGMSKESVEGLKTVIELAESLQIKPILDRVYKFSAIQDAHQYVEEGHKVGNVILEWD